MKRLICNLFGHKFVWYQWDPFHKQGVCNRCELVKNRYLVDATEWAGVIGSNGTS